jgi:gliding motility-associated-like protein
MPFRNHIRQFLAFLFILISGILPAQTYWLNHGGGVTIDEGTDVAVDGAGNTFVTGYFTTGATFGSYTINSAGVDDVFLAKLDVAGLYLWAVSAGGAGSERALSVKADAAGNSYITGYFYGTANFGANTITATGAQDIFIAKYDPSGTCLWAKSAGGAGADIGNGITVDNSGNVIVTGEFVGAATFGSATLNSLIGSVDVFTTKLDASGNFLWTEKGSARQTDRGLDVDCDAAGNIYITGQFSDTITFDLPHNNTMLNAIFVVKYNAAGVEQWFQRNGGGVVNTVTSIACDGGTGIYITGDFQGTLTFFQSPNYLLNGTYTNCIFIGKYDPTGLLSWAVSESSDSPLSSRSITANATACFISGNFSCTFDSYRDRYGPAIFNSSGYWDIFEGEYNSGTGTWTRCQQLGGKKDQFSSGIAVDAAGHPHMAGSYYSNIISPVTGNFYNYPAFSGYNLQFVNNVAANAGYCNDPFYNAYARANAAGNADVFVANAIDPTRAPYDYYYRTGTGCTYPYVDLCIKKYDGLDYDCAGDTAEGCLYVLLHAASQTSAFNPTNSVGPDFVYQWSNGPNTYINTVTSTGYYSVTMSTEDGCYGPQEDTIYVIIHPNPPPPTISDNVVINNNATQPLDVQVCSDSVILTGGNFGNSTVFWNGPAFGIDSNAVVMVDSSGFYTFTIIDQFGCTSSNTVEVILDDTLPVIAPAFVCLNDSDYNDSLRMCLGVRVELFPYDTVLNPLANQFCMENFTYIHWEITPQSNASISDSTNCDANFAIGYANVDTTGWYTITAMIIQANTCAIDTFLYTHSYFIEILPTPPSGTLTLTITGNTLLCPGDSTMLVVTGGYSYIWSNGDTNDTIWVSTAGPYSVISSDSVTNSYGCTGYYYGMASILIVLKTQPVVTMLPSNGVICPGDSVQLVTTGSGNFNWQGPNGAIGNNTNSVWVTSPGLYYCIVSDVDSCVLLSNTVSVQQYNTPTIDAFPAQVICPGDTVTLNVISSNGGTITWLPPLSGSAITQYVTSPGTYSCVVSACNIPTTISVTILATTVTAQISALSDTTICEGDSVLLGANAGLDLYNWQPGNSAAQSLYVYNTGMYYLTTSDSGGCTARDSFAVNFTPNILNAPFVMDTVICAGLPVTLSAIGTPSFYWYDLPAGNLLSTGTAFTTGPINNDTAFYVMTNDGVCRSQFSSVDITIQDCPSFIPNVFSPNGDGTNDYWSPFNPYAKAIHVWIYNRWGELVYEWTVPGGYWDGTYYRNGEPVSDGVYYYVARITEPTDQIHNESGFIQLVRGGQ